MKAADKALFSFMEGKTYQEQAVISWAYSNAVSGSLDALNSKSGIPVIYASCYKPLVEEKAASWLSKPFTYWYLEKNGYRRVLQEGDL